MRRLSRQALLLPPQDTLSDAGRVGMYLPYMAVRIPPHLNLKKELTPSIIMNREELLFSVRTLSRSLDAAAFAHIVKHTPPSDLVEALDILSTKETLALLMTLNLQARAELFTHFPELRQDILLWAMPREAVAQLFEWMPSDDRADLYNRLSEEAKEKLLPALAKVERDDILKLAAYPEGTVGSVSTSDYVHVSPEMTVAEALAHIRSTAPDKELKTVLDCQPNSEKSPFVQSRSVPRRMRGYGVWAGAGVMLPRPLQGWSGAGL